MSLLRVVHIDAGKSWRGGQRQALLLALGLRAQGHESLVIGPPGSPLVERAEAAGLATLPVRMRGEWDIPAALRIGKAIRSFGADIVHAHDARAHALALVALVGRSGPPLVVTRRVPFPPKGRVKYGDRVSRFIAVSRAVRHVMIDAGIDGERVEVVHSGIELPALNLQPRDWRGELAWPADSVLCGVVGAMTAEKGTDLLDAIASALSPESRTRARFILIGGDSKGGRTLGELAAHDAGFVSDIAPAVAGLDILVHPSRAEGLGTSLLDAMAVGVPPVAFDTGGVGEIVETGANGILVPPGAISAFAAALDSIILDAGERRRLGEAARRRAEHFDAARMTLGTEAVYHRVQRG